MKQKQTYKDKYNTLIIINVIFFLCVEAYRIYSGIMLHFLSLQIGSKIDCSVYTGMYNFMKEITVYIFSREKSLFTLINDVLYVSSQIHYYIFYNGLTQLFNLF